MQKLKQNLGKKLRVGLLIDDLGSGGAQRQLCELAVGLKKCSVLPYVFYYNQPEFFLHELKINNIAVIRIEKKPGKSFKMLFALRKLLKKHQIQILHSFLPAPNVYGVLACKTLRIAKSLASDLSNPPEGFYGFLENLALKYADHLQTNSMYAFDRLLARGIKSTDSITNIYNGVDLSRFDSANFDLRKLRQKYGFGTDERILLMIARSSPEKNHLAVLNAFKNALEKFTNKWKLCILGHDQTTPYGAKLEQNISELKLTDKVILIPVICEVQEVLAISTALILASLFEGTPNVVLEAEAAAKPVIASEIADIKKLLPPTMHDLLFDPLDTTMITKSMLKLDAYSKPQLLRLGQNGRKHVTSNFAGRTNLDEQVKLYLKLIA